MSKEKTYLTVYFLIFGGNPKKIKKSKVAIENSSIKKNKNLKAYNKIVRSKDKNSYEITPIKESKSFEEIVDLINLASLKYMILHNIDFVVSNSDAITDDLGDIAKEMENNGTFFNISASAIICCPIALACAENNLKWVGEVNDVDYRFLGTQNEITPIPFILSYKFTRTRLNPYESLINSFNTSSLSIPTYQHRYELEEYDKLAREYVTHFANIINLDTLAKMTKYYENSTPKTR